MLLASSKVGLEMMNAFIKLKLGFKSESQRDKWIQAEKQKIQEEEHVHRQLKT